MTLLFYALDLGWEGHAIAEAFGHIFFRTSSQKKAEMPHVAVLPNEVGSSKVIDFGSSS